ncbi:MAG: hypothetical protein QM690_22295, partial [Sphingobium sp.]
MKQEVPVELAQAGAGSPAPARAFGPAHGFGAPAPAKFCPFIGPEGRVAVLSNARAHRNRRAGAVERDLSARIWQAAPHTKAELDRTLAGFARERIDTIIVDGGDGTVRDVLSLAPRHFT